MSRFQRRSVDSDSVGIPTNLFPVDSPGFDPSSRDVPGDPGGPDPDVSVVLPFHNESQNLRDLHARVRQALNHAGLSHELIFVDDGSTDESAEIIEELAGTDHRVKLLVLSRNFGQHVAATAGLDVARGRVVVWMDTDLQEPPEDIPRLIEKFREGFDIVYARRLRRGVPFWHGGVRRTVLTMMGRLAGLDVPADRACMRLLARNVVDALRRCPERNRYMAYLIPWLGFRSAEIEIDVGPRQGGTSSYSPLKLMKLGLTGLTSFSVAPLRLAALFSVLTSLLCAGAIGYVLYRYLIHGFVITGWASLMITVLMLHALQFGVLAALGEYVGLSYSESKRRPLYVCRRTVNLVGAGASHPWNKAKSTDPVADRFPGNDRIHRSNVHDRPVETGCPWSAARSVGDDSGIEGRGVVGLGGCLGVGTTVSANRSVLGPTPEITGEPSIPVPSASCIRSDHP